MTEYNLEDYTYKTVVINWYDDPKDTEMEVDVVIGDGKTVFDENFPYDARIFFYFHDNAEYESAKTDTPDAGVEFRILREVD